MILNGCRAQSWVKQVIKFNKININIDKIIVVVRCNLEVVELKSNSTAGAVRVEENLSWKSADSADFIAN